MTIDLPEEYRMMMNAGPDRTSTGNLYNTLMRVYGPKVINQELERRGVDKSAVAKWLLRDDGTVAVSVKKQILQALKNIEKTHPVKNAPVELIAGTKEYKLAEERRQMLDDYYDLKKTFGNRPFTHSDCYTIVPLARRLWKMAQPDLAMLIGSPGKGYEINPAFQPEIYQVQTTKPPEESPKPEPTKEN